MATCGSGCRGTFEQTLAYNVERGAVGHAQRLGRIGVDGSPQDVREYPVWLTPGR